VKKKAISGLFFIGLFFAWNGALAAPKGKPKRVIKPVLKSTHKPAKKVGRKTKAKAAQKPPTKAISKPKPDFFETKINEAIEPADPSYRFHRFKLNTTLGMNVIQGSALASGMQFGFAPITSTPFYLGPEFNFSLFSPGSLLSLLAGGWYDWRVHGASKLTLSVGVVAGPGFATNLPSFPTSSLVTFLDLAFAQEMDDLISIRAQFRPGYIDKRFAFMMNFNVSFRFP
jgi:hypothetical protein